MLAVSGVIIKILTFAVIIILIVMIALSVSRSRYQKISQIVDDLEKLKSNSEPDMQYAIDENISFFMAIRFLPSYLLWGLTRRKRVDPAKLLEIADLPLPRWEKELYSDLNKVERKELPGLTKPLRKILLSEIRNSERGLIVLDLGCGGMEAERQVLVNLHKSEFKHNTVFIGIDFAEQAWESIIENLKELKATIEIKKINDLRDIKKYIPKKPSVLFYQGDALEIAEFHKDTFDIIFSSRLKHHLSEIEKKRLDNISQQVSATVIEYDDYRTRLSWLPPILTAWYKPILLNGSIFSQIRQPSKSDILREIKTNNDSRLGIKLFSPPGSYAKVFASHRKER